MATEMENFFMIFLIVSIISHLDKLEIPFLLQSAIAI